MFMFLSLPSPPLPSRPGIDSPPGKIFTLTSFGEMKNVKSFLE